MSVGLAAMLAGLFVVPALLLYVGHRLRRRSRRARSIFWGALLGHSIGAVFALWYSMIPPEAWTSGDFTRGIAGFYGMLAGGAAGALIGAIAGRRPTVSSPE